MGVAGSRPRLPDVHTWLLVHVRFFYDRELPLVRHLRCCVLHPVTLVYAE